MKTSFSVGDIVVSQVAYEGHVGIVSEVKIITASVPNSDELRHLRLPDYQRVCVRYPDGTMTEGAAHFYTLAAAMSADLYTLAYTLAQIDRSDATVLAQHRAAMSLVS